MNTESDIYYLKTNFFNLRQNTRHINLNMRKG